MIDIQSCPKFATCSAAICPLHDQWRNCRHLPGEAACFYLRELSKADGEERVRGTLPGELVEPMVEAYQEIMGSQTLPLARGFGVLRRVLRRSSKFGSRIEAGERLQAYRP